MENKGEIMKIYLVEPKNNKELYDYLRRRYVITNEKKINEAHVIIVNKVYNVNLALKIVDSALNCGKEVICIRNNFAKEHYVCNYLIQNGAKYV